MPEQRADTALEVAIHSGLTDSASAPALDGLRSLMAAGSSTVRYFVRQHLQQGERVPFALLRRTTDGTTVRDEVLRDVDVWEPDRNGSIERAIRSPLDSDLEEVTAASAAAVEQMVADRRYRPLP